MGRKLADSSHAPIHMVTISQLQHGIQSLIVDGALFGKRCRLTVDTGASRTIVRTDLIAKWRLHPARGLYTLTTATGDKAPIHGITQAEIQIGQHLILQEVLVADIIDEVILGLDLLQSEGVVLDIEARTLKIGNEEVVMSTSRNENTICRVIVQEDVLLPPKSEFNIPVKLEGDKNQGMVGVIEPLAETNKKGLLLARTLVQTDSKPIFVRVANFNTYQQKFPKGTVVGTCERVQEVHHLEKKTEASHLNTRLPEALQQVLQRSQGNLDNGQTNRLKQLLGKYQDVFSLTDSDNGRTSLIRHRIDTGNSRPIKQAPRRVPLAKQEEVDRMLRDMKAQGTIEPSQSPWASPVVLVKKKDGSTRFCVDYRKLNDVTKKDSYPLPRIEDTLDTLSGTRWFSTLDLKSGYWQVEINAEDKEKTAFSTGSGLWQFTVMPFGLCNAPATFERLMETVLHGLHWRTCLIYLDDVIILGKTFEEHLKNLEEVLQKFRAANLKLNPKKCDLFQEEVNYLGHVISSKGIRTDPAKTDAVRQWPIPKSAHDLRSFLGLCSYYRKFVKGFADIAKPLHRLTEENQPFVWTAGCQQAFKTLKDRLCSAPVLVYPTAGKEFIVDTDARTPDTDTDTGIGGVLSQLEDGQVKVVGYFSKTLSKAERNYCVTRRELLAIVKTLEHFHKYLYGQPFLIRTDHASLKWLLQFKNPEGQIARWLQRLQEYQFRIEHRKGAQHGNADALSRRPCGEDCRHCNKAEEKEGLVAPVCLRTRIDVAAPWTFEQLRQDQMTDEAIGPILALKESNSERPQWSGVSDKSAELKCYWAQWDSLVIEDGVLKRVWESADGKRQVKQTVVPRTRVPELLREYHSGVTGGHLGINRTLAKIREHFYWLKCRVDVEKWCRSCDNCAASKGPRTRSRGVMKQYLVGAPFERIAIDVAGPFPVTQSGNRYILVAMDYFSKWPEVYALPNQETTTVAEALVTNMFCRFGVPREIHSDQGRNFESAVFRRVCELLNISKTRTTPLHPQSDGMVERFNRTIENYLRAVVNDHQDDWDKHLPFFLLAYRSAVHETTGKTPANVLFGRELRLPADLMFGNPEERNEQAEDYVDDLAKRLEETHQQVRSKMRLESDRMKTRYDLRANNFGFQAGDKVWLYNPIRRKGRSPKLQQAWEGPYSVIKRINDVVYRIQRTPRSKMKVVHIDRLTPYNATHVKSDRDDQA